MDYIILNGIKSNSIKGLMIQSLPFISKPKIRTQVEEIDGVDGDIVTKLGYSAYDRTLKIGLYGNYDIDDIIQYFNSEGTVTFSNEPDKYYSYQILEAIDFERLIKFRQANVIFHVQPFKYSTIEQPLGISPNILNVPNYSSSSNGITTSVNGGTIVMKGTATKNTEFYLPVKMNVLVEGNYSFNVSSWGNNSNGVAVRMIKSSPTNNDSFGNNYLNLVTNVVATLKGTAVDDDIYNYLWFYIPKGTSVNFNASASMVNTTQNNYTINNIGNVISRPVITLYGNGSANIYINGHKILSVNFSDSITIDGLTMNAYNDSEFMNRSVTGNYENLIFNVGSNIFSWDGDITFINVDKYSRWI